MHECNALAGSSFSKHQTIHSETSPNSVIPFRSLDNKAVVEDSS